jgi:hypothetical protein
VPAVILPAGTPVPMESPSLAAGRDVAAYELKFLLTEAQAREVEERVRGALVPDAHADPDLGGGYRTTSLYCDTPDLAVYYRVGQYKRRKHRLRRYGRDDGVYLERKTKWGDRVRKRRTAIAGAELGQLAHPMSAIDWPGHWFHRHLLRRQLVPVCRIAYERVALVGHSAEGPLRLTFDRRVRGVLTRDWCVEAFDGGHPLLTDGVVCEFKYRGFVPALFKDVIGRMGLTPAPVSKYRAFVRAAGLAGHAEGR